MTDQQAAQTDTGTLLECPFCASTDIDPEGWASTERSGPACQDCGASADTVEIWNTRPALRATTPATAGARCSKCGSQLLQCDCSLPAPPAQPAGGEVEREALARDISKGDDTDTSDWDDCLILADHLIASGWKRLAYPGGGSREEVTGRWNGGRIRILEDDIALSQTAIATHAGLRIVDSEEIGDRSDVDAALRPSGPQAAEGDR